MNTPTHIILNYALLQDKTNKKEKWAILIGSVLPDITIFFMFFWALMMGIDQSTLWREIYFQPEWQFVKNIFNSVPFALIILTFGFAIKKRWIQLFSYSLLIHYVLDFFTHVNDGHAHFFPLTNFIYQSPISYWDQNFYGTLGSTIELSLLAVAVLYIVPRLETWYMKSLVIAALILSISGGVIAPLLFSFSMAS